MGQRSRKGFCDSLCQVVVLEVTTILTLALFGTVITFLVLDKSDSIVILATSTVCLFRIHFGLFWAEVQAEAPTSGDRHPLLIALASSQRLVAHTGEQSSWFSVLSH